jgi:hypothetical protein
MAGTGDAADARGEIRAFLSTRRARISPAQAGLPVYRGEHRRVSGLRREEVAVLAGISTEYYTRFERGTPPASPRASSTASRTRCSSTTLSGRTFSA